jgi:hypothetical protein
VTAPPGTLAQWDQTPEAPEGAGIVSSYADFFASDFDDGFQVAFNAAAVGLDTLGFVADPLGSLVGAGIGWLIEHISFLREPLDALTGDPLQIKAAAQSWHGVSLHLSAVATELRGSSGPASGAAVVPAGWDGAAARAYGLAAADRAGRIDFVAVKSDELAVSLVKQGALIGTIRSLIRDAITGLVTEAIEWAAGGALAALVTGGASLVVAAGWIIARAISLASRFARWVADLLSALADAGHALSGLARGVQDAARVLGRTGRRLHEEAEPLADTADDLPLLGETIESGKQFTDAELEDPAAQPG